MKTINLRVALFTVLGLLSLIPAKAQNIELTPFGGWLWTGSVPTWRQDLKVDDKGNYGGRLGITVRPQVMAEFEWNHTSTTIHYYDFDKKRSGNVPMTMNYYMLGGIYETMEGQVVPYGLLNIGLISFHSDRTVDLGSYSETWFAAGVGAGVKYFVTPALGIRLQARLLVPMQFAGVGIGCGIGTGGSGCGVGVNSYSNIIQGDFTGGVILRLKHD